MKEAPEGLVQGGVTPPRRLSCHLQETEKVPEGTTQGHLGSQRGFYKRSVKPSHPSISGPGAHTAVSPNAPPRTHPDSLRGETTQAGRETAYTRPACPPPACGSSLQRRSPLHRSLPMSSPPGPETAARVVEQGHLWLECRTKGLRWAVPPGRCASPRPAATVSAREEGGSASTEAGAWAEGAGARAGRGRGQQPEKASAQALPHLQEETPAHSLI